MMKREKESWSKMTEKMNICKEEGSIRRKRNRKIKIYY
jgi:hypothetical protein